MLKNVSGQKIGAQLVSATDGSNFTGSVTVYVTGDAGTQSVGSVGSGACTHEGKGYHTYAPAQAETNYDLVAFTFEGTGAITVTVQFYTLPTTGVLSPATLGRTLVVDASGLADANVVKVGPTGSGTAQTAKDIGAAVPAAAAGASGGLIINGSNSGTVTLAALTCTGSFTISDGLLISRSSSNTSAITATGNGTGSGAVFTSGSGATGNGINAISASTNGHGINLDSTGSGSGLKTDSITSLDSDLGSVLMTSMGVDSITVDTGLSILTLDITDLNVLDTTTFTGPVIGTNASNNLRINGVAPGSSGGLFIAGTNAATVVTTSFTTTFTGNLSGSVGSLATQAKADVNAEVDTAIVDGIPDIYHTDIQFTRDQSNTQDEWTVTFFKNGVRLTSGVTSPTIQLVKRSDGTDLLAATALTEIGTTESFKYDATGSERITVGEAVLAITSATIDAGTRTYSRLIGRDST